MNEKLTLVKVGDTEFPLLYNATAFLDFEEKYGDGMSLNELFVGPEIYDTDTKKEKADKEAARKKATAYFKRQTPWIISALARQGCLAQAEQGKKTKPPTEEWVALHWTVQQFPYILNSVFLAFNEGMKTEHKKGEDKEVDVVLEEIDLKNAEGAAE